MKKLSFLLLFLHSFLIKGQCDVAITGVNLNTYEVTVEVINSAGCIAAPIGGTPGKVSQLQIGYHLPEPINPDNEVIEDFNETFGLPPCSPNWTGYLGQNPNSNYPGWWYSPSTSTTFDPEIMGDGLVTGDIVIIPLNPPGDYDTYPTPTAECGDDLIDYWLSEGECIEFVLWQINYGATWHTGNGGWATNTNNPDWIPNTYQDQDCDNSWYTCRDDNPNHPVASPDIDCLPNAPDAVIDNISFEIGCIGDVPAYSLTYTVYNYGSEDITNYCIEIWNEDYYQCFSDDLFGSYGIPVGEGQQFVSPFFEFTGNPGGFFTMSVDSVNDEIITGNNNTTIYFPDEWPECPTVADTVFVPTPADTVFTYIYQIDTILTYIETIDSIFIQLPADTIYLESDTVIITETEFIYDTTYVTEFVYDTTYIIETEFIYDTTYIEIQLPPDTIVITEVEYLTDTLYVDNYIYEYDTVYIDVPIVDTLYITETEIIYDTTFVTEYILLTDTITEYIVQEIWIDCETGLPCGEEPPGLECSDWTSIYAANTFTPNNDGINDAWILKYDLNCWENVEFTIYNRWGDIIYQASGDSFDGYPYWDGSVDDGDHYVSDGVYIYTFTAKKVGKAEVIREQGHVTVFR